MEQRNFRHEGKFDAALRSEVAVHRRRAFSVDFAAESRIEGSRSNIRRFINYFHFLGSVVRESALA